MEPSEFKLSELGEAPWILATPIERRVLETANRGAESLGEATSAIFTGLQTSADAIYIVADLGPSGGMRRVRSKASGKLIELEPDLLHPLASGSDVHRYAFAPIRQLLLFPYRRDEHGEMELIPWARIEELPQTARYLREHESALRGREGKMDHDGWYGYVYPKSLGLNDSVKLGVPRLCERLRASADPDGSIYLDNVDVNGIIAGEGGPSLWELAALLNTRLLDFLSKLHTVPFRGDYMSANKQFIAPLPIKVAERNGTSLGALGRQLHEVAMKIGAERQSFLDWLGDRIGRDPRSLPGKTKLAAYASHPPGELLNQLAKSATRLTVNPRGRAFGDQFKQEHSASAEQLQALYRKLATLQAETDRLVYDIYEITEADRGLVEDAYQAV